MFGSTYLDVAIGLVFVYLSLSLLCSAIHEWAAVIFEFRAKNLEQWIANMLNEPSGVRSRQGQPILAYYLRRWMEYLGVLFYHLPNPPARGQYLALLYDHVLIKGLSRQSWLDKRLSRGGSPSYISAFDFTEALVDVLRKQAATLSPPPAANTVGEIVEVVRALPESPLKDAVESFLHGQAATAQLDLEQLKDRLGRWYDSVMERASGWYKNKAQQGLALIAAVVVLGINVDSVAIVNRLWADPKVRDAVVAAAEKAVNDPIPSIPVNAAPKSDPDIADFRAEMDVVTRRLTTIQDQFSTFRLPFGWSRAEWDSLGLHQLPIRLFGWAITVVALTMGAPFWFDMLNKLVNVRSAGRRPANRAAGGGNAPGP